MRSFKLLLHRLFRRQQPVPSNRYACPTGRGRCGSCFYDAYRNPRGATSGDSYPSGDDKAYSYPCGAASGDSYPSSENKAYSYP